MKDTSILNSPHEILAIAPQLIGFRVRNRLLISIAKCIDCTKTEKDLMHFAANFQYSAKSNIRCTSIMPANLHFIEKVISLDLKRYENEEALMRVLRSINTENACVISIDWYCDDLFSVVKDENLLQQIKMVIYFFKNLHGKSFGKFNKQNIEKNFVSANFSETLLQESNDDQPWNLPTVVAHFSDYRNWIESKYLFEFNSLSKTQSNKYLKTDLQQIVKQNSWSYEAVEQMSIAKKYILRGAPMLAFSNRMTQKRIADEKISQLISVEISKNMKTESVVSGRKAWNQFICGKKPVALARDKSNLSNIALLLSAFEHFEIRDAVLLYALNNEIDEITAINIYEADRQLKEISEKSPSFSRIETVIKMLNSLVKYSLTSQSALYGAIAYLYWWIGKPAEAYENSYFALSTNPEYSLAKLILKVVEARVKPPWQEK